MLWPFDAGEYFGGVLVSGFEVELDRVFIPEIYCKGDMGDVWELI